MRFDQTTRSHKNIRLVLNFKGPQSINGHFDAKLELVTTYLSIRSR